MNLSLTFGAVVNVVSNSESVIAALTQPETYAVENTVAKHGHGVEMSSEGPTLVCGQGANIVPLCSAR